MDDWMPSDALSSYFFFLVLFDFPLWIGRRPLRSGGRNMPKALSFFYFFVNVLVPHTKWAIYIAVLSFRAFDHLPLPIPPAPPDSS